MKNTVKFIISCLIVLSGLVVWGYITRFNNFSNILYWVGMIYATFTITGPSIKYWEDYLK